MAETVFAIVAISLFTVTGEMMLTLDIGCGFRKQPGSIGIDRIGDSQADVIVDLAQLPFPFKDNSIGTVYCNDVLEHLPDIIGTMEEIWRICVANADVYIVSPSMSSVNLHNDPTHLRAFTSRSFDYFIAGEKSCKFGYSKARYEKVSVVYDAISRHDRRFYDRWMAAFATRHPLLYESRLAYIYPLSEISFHLRVKK
ncbi:MAG: methyltransferase domain-containing protein [Mariprofundales bacterium]